MEVVLPGGIQTEVRNYQMLTDGEWGASKSAKMFPVYDPSTEEVTEVGVGAKHVRQNQCAKA